MVHVIPPEHADLAIRFATRGADKFGGSEFVATKGGLPDLPGASVTLECDLEARHVAGDHTILIGRVRSTRVGEIGAVTYFRRAFHAIPRADGTGN
jgi:flavin reductase ActVB